MAETGSLELERLGRIESEALEALAAVDSTTALEAWKVAHLGRKSSPLASALDSLGTLPKEQRPAFGKRGNEVKRALEAAFDARAEALRQAELERELTAGAFDVTQPGRPVVRGGLHPARRMLREIFAVCAEMGFQVYRSRDVESDEYNFQLLNIPPHHPARDMWSTFYIQGDERAAEGTLVLRTHTSPGQVRAMREMAPNPIRIIVPGMVYRYEQVSARKEIQFHQVEGLAVGRNIRMTDLNGTLVEFTRRIFGAERPYRLRCSHFPFTEPSVEMDIECAVCHGAGCSICGSGWLEILGAGMVHPTVLRNGGYDPNTFSGFAWGMGPERIAMLKYGITDIRDFWANDLRFLEQF